MVSSQLVMDRKTESRVSSSSHPSGSAKGCSLCRMSRCFGKGIDEDDMLYLPRAREGPDPEVAAALKAAEGEDEEAREVMARRVMEVGRSMQGRRGTGLFKNQRRD